MACPCPRVPMSAIDPFSSARKARRSQDGDASNLKAGGREGHRANKEKPNHLRLAVCHKQHRLRLACERKESFAATRLRFEPSQGSHKGKAKKGKKKKSLQKQSPGLWLSIPLFFPFHPCKQSNKPRSVRRSSVFFRPGRS